MKRNCDMNIALNFYTNPARGREDNIDVFPCNYDIYVIFSEFTSAVDVCKIHDELSDIVHSIVSNRSYSNDKVESLIYAEVSEMNNDPYYEVDCTVIDVIIKYRKFDWA